MPNFIALSFSQAAQFCLAGERLQYLALLCELMSLYAPAEMFKTGSLIDTAQQRSWFMPG